MAPARKEPSLPDEILEDIFLRLTGPADLARAAAVCTSFRRVATGRRFLRRFLQPRLHPPPLLGFLEHRGSGGFHHAEPPYRSAPAARAVAQAVDFSFSFLPSPVGSWRVCDARDGRVLLSRSVSASASSFTDLAACDPLHRRYVQIPTIPGHLLSSSFAPYHDGVELEPFLAPDSGEEMDEPSFQVICCVRSWYSAVIFVFSSVTGSWSRATSISFPPRRAIRDPKLLVRYYACGCFCWVNGWDRYMLVLDRPRDDDMALSLVEVPRIQVAERHQGLAVVDAGKDRLYVVELDYWRHGLVLHRRTWRRNIGFEPEKWQHKILRLPEPEYYWYIKGAADGYLLMKAFPWDSSSQQQPEALYFTVELKTMLIEKLCVSDHHICHGYLYASFPPPLSPPSV